MKATSKHFAQAMESAYSNIALTFRSIYFTISEKDNLDTFVMYVPVKLRPDTTSSKATEYVLTITQKANTSILYKSLDEFERM